MQFLTAGFEDSSALFGGKGIARWLSDWRFQPNVTPFSYWAWPVGASVMYVLILFSLRHVMATRKALEFPRILFLHNITLCIASLFLGSWLTYTLADAFVNGLTAYQLVCSRQIYENGHMHMIYYINMFFKVWEFLDTFLLVVRKKQVAFLHAYHHAATLILTWNQLMEHSSPQWVPIVINLWVHVLMYYYYAMSALRIRIWWKKYLTTLQICQFVIDVTIIGYAYFTFIRAGFDDTVCYGTTTGALVGLGVLFSYLLLFVRFYFQTYSKPRSKESAKKVQ
ncbi:fatty acid elongase [Chondrus crispus]|uniref:Elongation of fatty acids protein n=1 Tax=Chondrus crispus TaxID=2769 RepID=R7QM39_CHOCR|nr:fatty acid elongase [Chondrus crispus]CDF38531.1 fatty acid elongase [Chondrus crispus]|eukprot:XP_005718424.1 fatty acid elongase [Chondrus crispus]